MPRRSDLQEIVQQFVDKLSSVIETGSRVACARSGFDRAGWARLGRRSRRRCHSQAPQRSNPALSGSWLLQSGSSGFRHGVLEAQRPAEGGNQEVPGCPAREEVEEAGQIAKTYWFGRRRRAPERARASGLGPGSRAKVCSARRAGDCRPAVPAPGESNPGVDDLSGLHRFFHGDCGDRDTRVMGSAGPARKSGAISPVSTWHCGCDWHVCQEADMAIATAPVDFEAY